MAEGGRFELPMPFDITVFKTAAFNHSAIPPVRRETCQNTDLLMKKNS